MPKKKVEVYDKDQLIYPFIENDHVTFSNGMKISEMLDQGISMPTITHNETSFKVGVGDSNVSSSIVDSSVSKMVIKGQTYQNILPEPSTHVLTNNKEMFKVNEGLDPNVEIVDGVSKSAILKGNTLLVDELGNECEIPNSPKITMGAWINTNTGVETASVTSFNTGFLKCPTVPFIVKGNNKYKRIVFYDKNKTFIRGIDTGVANNSDITIASTKIPSNAFYLRISASINTEGVSYTPDTKLLIEDMSGNNLYSTQLMSVKMPVLTTTGVNLYKDEGGKTNWTIDSSDNGGEKSGNRFVPNYYTPVEPETVFTLYRRVAYLNFGIRYYDKDKSYISVGIPPYNGTNRLSFTTPSNCYYVRFIDEYNEADNNYMIYKGDYEIDYEPYKTNILRTPEEVVLRSLPNGVKDTLNLMTGEYVQRIGEVVLDGSEAWNKDTTTGGTKDNTSIFHTEANFNGFKPSPNVEYRDTMMLCDKIPVKGRVYNLDEEGLMINGDGRIYIRINLSRLETNNAGGFKSFLAKENIKIQCELETPVIKTVDLSSSGNWEKVVLDGSEDESWGDGDNGLSKTHRFYVRIPNLLSGNHSPIIDSTYFTPIQSGTSSQDSPCVQVASNNIYFRIERQIADDLTSFKAWLQQNPLTVWYPTTAHQDSTQVKQPIFFKDGHVVQSSGADNSLIPTLDYQAKTSNSYVMDLMKANTRYTMKAKSASGTFTIDGTSYGAGTNGTFTTPSSMTNKFLVMSNKTNEEVIILEGDVTDKTIPYFKGIKSAFEDKDKIEVLSTGRNLCPPQPEVEGYYVRYQNGIYVQHDSYNVSKPIRVIEGHRYRLINTNKHHAYYDKNMNYVATPLFSGSDADFYSIAPKNAVYLRVSMMKGLEVVVNTDGAKGEYREPNSTKIPILSPLRSLPNGVCDEIILDREKNKATLIQRVGHTILGQNDGWGSYDNVGDTMKVGRSVLPHVKNRGEGMSTLIPYTFNSVSQPNEGVYIYRHASSSEVRVRLKLKRAGRHDAIGMQNWLRSNNIVTLYELETPIITEIDLEGFPYIYKDGHIFLNSEIVPTTEITYSINQCQQISASNEDIIRHEKELTYLQKLIAQYIQVDYESALLSLKV